MSGEKSKIKALIEYYGKSKGYPEKSYVAQFCKDFDLSYNQWNAYTRNAQVQGMAVINKLMDIFPNLNLNWYLKDDYNMWIQDGDSEISFVKESEMPDEITLKTIYAKLLEIETEVKK